jgi:phage major head subunit gpT-like protein
MTMQRSNSPEVLAQGLRSILFEKYASYPWEYKQIFNVLKSGKKEEEDFSLSGLGLMPQKPEGQSIVYDDPISGFSTKYTHVSYGMGFRVTHEMLEDDQYGKIRKMPLALARSARHTIEQTAANIFNFGFVTAHNVGGDGKALFATDHALSGGGTSSNRPAIGADLSLTSLQEAILTMEETVDDRGLLLAIKPKMLIVPPELRWTARELLDSKLKPGVETNDINPILEDDLNYFVYHYLTDDDAWFLVGDKDDHEMNFFWREPLTTESEEDFDTGDMKFKAFMRFSVKWSDWRGVYGSPGA